MEINVPVPRPECQNDVPHWNWHSQLPRLLRFEAMEVVFGFGPVSLVARATAVVTALDVGELENCHPLRERSCTHVVPVPPPPTHAPHSLLHHRRDTTYEIRGAKTFLVH